MKRVFIIHGWGGSPDETWLVWLARELEKRGFVVFRLEMPDTNKPTIQSWVQKLSDSVCSVSDSTYFVGHSIGCQAVMRYLETLPENSKIGGAVFVAGWFDLTDETWDDVYTREVAGQWINTPINFKRLQQLTNKYVAIMSNNDPYVSLDNAEVFKKQLGAKVFIEENKGHISQEDGVDELPSALDVILELSR